MSKNGPTRAKQAKSTKQTKITLVRSVVSAARTSVSLAWTAFQAWFVALLPWTETEHKKTIIKKGWRPALKRCSIHVVPLAAVAVILGLNLQTLFIGQQYLGNNSDQNQKFYVLLLQLTAKMIVCLPGLPSRVVGVLLTAKTGAIHHRINNSHTPRCSAPRSATQGGWLTPGSLCPP